MKNPHSAIRNPQFYFSALIVILALAARLVPGPRTIDDSYITFRYARNLLAGSGFTYNPGEPVLGTTTPLYTFLMAGLGALSGGTNAPFPELALGLNALADAATCLLLVWLGRRAGARFAGWAAAAVWAVAPFSVTFAIGGLETSLYILLLTGAVAAALAAGSRARVAAALLGALALLTRPDALILLGPLVLERIYSAYIGRPRQKISAAEVLAFGLPVLAWGAFATLTFGSPLPHSVLAKAAAYRLEPNDALIRLIQHYATPFLEQNLLGAPLAVALGIVLYPVLFAVGAVRAWKVEKRLLPWIAYPWLYLVTFALPNPLIFRWYLTPPLPAYYLFILMGMESILVNFRFPAMGASRSIFDFRLTRLSLADIKAGQEKPPIPAIPQPENTNQPAFQLKIKNLKSKILFLLLLYPLVFSLSDWRLLPDHGPARPAPQMAFIKLELLYRQAAARIAPDLNGRSVLAAGDVGVLGYYTPARILDTVGLNSPVSTTYYPIPPDQYVINYAIPARLILDQQPDYLVVLEVYVRNTLLKDPTFLQQYHLVDKIDTDMYGSDGMLIFKK